MSLRRLIVLRIEATLRVIFACEVMYWSGLVAYALLLNFRDLRDPILLIEFQAKYGSGTQEKAAKANSDYQKYLLNSEYAMHWVIITSVVLLCNQILLILGVQKKNRCLIFCWMLFMVLLGATAVVSISTLQVPSTIKYLNLSWVAQTYFLYVAAQYVLKLTNAQAGAEEVGPPYFRPQTCDPRQFREGLNYPVFPRSLEFADRVSGLHKMEHLHPRKGVPTYDAINIDGRMVVVVDDPPYEKL